LASSQTVQARVRSPLKVRLSRRATLALRRALEHGGHPVVRIRLWASDVAGNRSSVVRVTVQAVR
jgi:hypothetical protein